MLDTRWKSGNVCTIPWEVLTTAGKIVRVGLRATQQKRTVLATPMFGIGTVQLGTDPVGDKSADPALPVWEQLREDFSKRSYGCSTWLEKFTDPKVNSTIIRIHFANIDCIPAGARLHLYRCIRNRGARTHWVHPVDWHEDPKPGQHRWGYGLIQDKVDYPLVPDWMPNNGYMQTEFTISSADRELGYVDIPLSEYLLPLLKPVDKEHSWRELGFIGLQGNGQANSHLLRFRICKDGTPIDIPGDTLRIGFRNQLSVPAMFEAGKLSTGSLYTSIR